MKEKTRRILWYLVGIGVVIVFLLVLVSAVINVGEKLRQIHLAVEISFYVLVAFLVVFLVINPLRIILTSPSLSIVTTLDKDSAKAHQIYKSVVKNIKKQNDYVLTAEEKQLLDQYRNWEELRLALSVCYNGTIKQQIRKIIIKHAKTVLLTTAISQNEQVDMFSVIAINLGLIKNVVQTCGFRPSMKNLSKLAFKVAGTALVANTLQSIKIEDILPARMVDKIPFIGPIVSSVVQGISNALLTIRIGLVTRNYLFSDSNSVTKAEIQAQAFKDALVLLPIVVGEILSYLPSKVVQFFKDKKARNEDVKNEKKLIEGELNA